jgi:hypothetical protein
LLKLSHYQATRGLARVFYALFKRLFILLTGRRIDFGNFLLIPWPMVTRLAHMPETWNHLAAAVLRSRLRVVSVPTERGRRCAGSSSMGLVSLLAHGLSAIAVFSDIVFVRLLVLASTVSALALTLGTGAAAVRIATDLAIPGWASNVVGISAMLFQAVTPVSCREPDDARQSLACLLHPRPSCRRICRRADRPLRKMA